MRVPGIEFTLQQSRKHGQGDTPWEPLGAGGKLAPNHDARVPLGHHGELLRKRLRGCSSVPQQSHRPCADVFRRVAQEVRSHIVVQAAADMERPQVLESQVLVPGLDDRVSQVFVNAFVAAVSQYSARLEGVPAIRIFQVVDQFGARQPFQVNIPCGLRALRLDLVNPPIGAVPLGVRIGVSGPLVMEITDVHRAIGTERQIRRREPGVVGVEQRPDLQGFERRAARLHPPPRSGVAQEIGSDETLMERLRE